MPLNKADKKRIRQQLIQGQVQIARIDQSNLAEVVWDLIDDYTKDGEGKRQALIQQILLQMPEIALAQFSRGSGTPTNLLSLSCNASDAHIRKFIPSLLNAASEFKEKSEQQEVELCKSIYTIIALAYTGDDQKSIAREVCNVVSTSPNLATLKAVKAKDGSQVSLAQCLLSGSERQKVYYGTFFRASTAGKSDEEISAAIADAMRRYYGKGATDIDSEVWGYILESMSVAPLP